MNLEIARIYAETGSIIKVTAQPMWNKWVLNIECNIAAADKSGLLETARGETRFFKSLDSVYRCAKQIAPDMLVVF